MSKAGRKTTSVTHPEKVAIEHAGVEALPALAGHLQQAQANAVALAEQMGYTGALTVGGLEDEIKFYQRRSVEAVLETGKRLILLKEITDHGEFIAVLDRLGLQSRLVQKLMQATVKFSNTPSTALLTSPCMTQTKLLELLILDEGEIEALDKGGTVRGLTLDKVDCMSVSELRAALRQAAREQAAEKATQTEITRRRDERINALEAENASLTSTPKSPAMIEEEQLHAVNEHSLMLVREIEVGLRALFCKLERLFDDTAPPNHVRLAQQQAIAQVLQAARMLAGDHGIALKLEDQEPQVLLWHTQGEAMFGAAADADIAASKR